MDWFLVLIKVLISQKKKKKKMDKVPLANYIYADRPIFSTYLGSSYTFPAKESLRFISIKWAK
jgi:hypothetical protein